MIEAPPQLPLGVYIPSHHDIVELAFVRVLAESKNALDAHMEVYIRTPEGTRAAPYSEAVSISATQRIVYECCASVEARLKEFKLNPAILRGKHQLCLRVTRKFIRDTHHNNLIVDHPKADAAKFGRGLALFLAALHYGLAEATPKEARYAHTKAWLQYSQDCHTDDPNVVANVP